jgi:hypothetical protein
MDQWASVFELGKYSNGTFATAKVRGDETEEKGTITMIGDGDSAIAAELSEMPISCITRTREEAPLWNWWKARFSQESQSWMTTNLDD